jgi:chromosome segregation ATPase
MFEGMTIDQISALSRQGMIGIKGGTNKVTIEGMEPNGLLRGRVNGRMGNIVGLLWRPSDGVCVDVLNLGETYNLVRLDKIAKEAWVIDPDGYGGGKFIKVDLDKYYAFEYILEDANREVEAKDRHIEELERSNKALLDQVASLQPLADRCKKADERYGTMANIEFNTNTRLQARLKEVEELKSKLEHVKAENDALVYNLEQSNKLVKEIREGSHAKIMKHEQTIDSLHERIGNLNTQISTQRTTIEWYKSIDEHTKLVVDRLNLQNKGLLDEVDRLRQQICDTRVSVKEAKLEQRLVEQEELIKYILEGLDATEADVERAKSETRSVKRAIHITADLLWHTLYTGDVATTLTSLRTMSEPSYLKEYCRD